MEAIYAIEKEQLEAIRAIADKLHAGSDKERDLGHKLWSIISQVENQKIEDVNAD